MRTNIALIFLFWTIPTLIYYFFPFGAQASEELIYILLITNLLLYAPALLFIGRSDMQDGKYKMYVSQKNIQIIGVVVFVLNLYILYKVGFVFGVEDDSIRTQVYESAGVLWSILVAMYSIYYLIIGFNGAIERQFILTTCLSAVNAVIFVAYGMKAGVVQIIISYAIGWFSAQNKNKHLVIYYNMMKMTAFIFVGFWVVNSFRAKELINVIDFFELIYYYIAPNFKNFENTLGVHYGYDTIMGGVFGGIFKVIMPRYFDPLIYSDMNLLEYQTWNVWSYLTTFYISGGLFEVYFGTFLVGVYTTFSLILFMRRRSILYGTNLSQNFLLLLFLHNQYYFSSAAPFAAIGISLILEAICGKETNL